MAKKHPPGSRMVMLGTEAASLLSALTELMETAKRNSPPDSPTRNIDVRPGNLCRLALATTLEVFNGSVRRQVQAEVAPGLTKIALENGLPMVLSRLQPEHSWEVSVGPDWKLTVYRDGEPLPDATDLELSGGQMLPGEAQPTGRTVN